MVKENINKIIANVQSHRETHLHNMEEHRKLATFHTESQEACLTAVTALDIELEELHTRLVFEQLNTIIENGDNK